MKRAIIIGASSGMGRQVAQLLLQDGWTVGLAARRTERLDELKTIAPERVTTAKIDVTQNDATNQLQELIKKTGGMNLFFYAAGVGKQNPQLDEEIELWTTETNAMGFTRMVGEAFRYFADNQGGHIAVISSIAGTKGLGLAPSYSATKALQNTYIEALEQLSFKQKLNITFTDIRPGFVNTELLFPDKKDAPSALPTKGPIGFADSYPMLMSVSRVVRIAMKAVNKRRHVVVVDWRWRIVTVIWRCLPHWLWRRIKL